MDGIIKFVNDYPEFFKFLVQLIILVIPFILTWYVRTYVKSAEQQKRLAAIVRLANTGIDYAEDLHKRGDLDKYLKKWNLSDEVISQTSTGIQKLNIAGRFVEQELNRLGIKMTDEEAQAWIASEFQRRIGDIARGESVDQRAQEAMGLLRALEQAGLISLPADISRSTQLASHIANWAITQPDKDIPGALREEALARVRTELGTQPQPPVEVAEEPQPAVVAPQPSPEAQLMELATQSVAYVEQLKLEHKLTLSETDVAAAWVLTGVTQKGLQVTTDQIASAVRAAFERKRAQ